MTQFNHLYSKPFTPFYLSSKCRTSLPIRISNHQDIAIKASLDFLEAWEVLCPPVPGLREYFLYCLCSCREGHLISWALPEARPDRIAVITKVAGFFLAAVDLIGRPGGSQALTTAESLSHLDEREDNATKNGLESILSEICHEVVLQDPVLGNPFMQTMLKHWDFLKRKSETKQEMPATFLDFFPVRFANFASRITIDMASYALSIQLDPTEKASLKHLVIATSTAQILWSDLHSWGQEQRDYEVALDAKRRSPGPTTPTPTLPVNTINVLSLEHGIDAYQAALVCRRKLGQYERFCGLLANGILRGQDGSGAGVSEGVKKMVETYKLGVAGWAYWCCVSPRYLDCGGQMEWREGMEEWRREHEGLGYEDPNEAELDVMFWREWGVLFRRCWDVQERVWG